MKKIFLFVIFTAFMISGCSKMEDKKTAPKTTTQNNPPSGELPPNHPPIDGTDKSKTQGTKSDKDEDVIAYKKAAEDADAKYEKEKSDANKKAVVEKNLAAGNYMMFEADVPPKEKYRPALKYYRKVLAVDPKNQEAIANKDKIEEIYTQMGLPIPQ